MSFFNYSLHGISALDFLLENVNKYNVDRNYSIPDNAKEIYKKFDNKTRFVLLGSKDFAVAFSLAAQNNFEIAYVVDDYKANKGEQLSGVDIVSVDYFLNNIKRDKSVIAINSCRYDYSKRFFDELCWFNSIPVLNYEQAVRLLNLNLYVDYRVADWGDVISNRINEFVRLENKLDDERSKQTLLRVLLFHLTADPEWILSTAHPYCTLYFRSGVLNFSDSEKFVDCGASIGESISGMIGATKGMLKRAWLIEPDKFNILKLENIVRKYKNTKLDGKITLHPCAVGEHSGEVFFNHVGGHGGSIIPDGKGIFEKSLIKKIDEIVDDLPTFIKMDIEGFELPALKGAKTSIQQGKPKMAISAYHRAADLLDITNFVESISPGYKVGLRHHTEERWDTCLYFYR